MARLFVDGDWYEEVSSHSHYEVEYQHLVLKNVETWYPAYVAVKFDLLVTSEEGKAKPDLVFVHREYRDWWVVEVEMAHHSFSGHVLPQVQRLAGAHYGDAAIAQVARRARHLDRRRLSEMAKGRQPRVLVVVNAPCPTWESSLRLYNARLAVVQAFRSSRNKYVYRLNGESLLTRSDLVSECSFEPGLPGFLSVDSPAALRVRNGKMVPIRFRDTVSLWIRRDIKDKVYLVAEGENPLPRDSRVYVARLVDGSLSFEHER